MRREEEAWYHLEWFIELMEAQEIITQVSKDMLLGDLDQFRAYAFNWDEVKPEAPKEEYSLPTDNPCNECFYEDSIPTVVQKSQCEYRENPHGLL